MTDRLDRIETDLETVKEILLSTARHAAAADKRAEDTNKQVEDIAQSLQEQNRLASERGQKIDQRFEQLREDIDIAFQTISLLSENTDRSMAEFRAEMRASRTETRAIWDYLMRKSQNGNGDGNV